MYLHSITALWLKKYGPKTIGITQELVKQIPHFNKSPVTFACENLRSIDVEQGSANYGLQAESGLFFVNTVLLE